MLSLIHVIVLPLSWVCCYIGFVASWRQSKDDIIKITASGWQHQDGQQLMFSFFVVVLVFSVLCICAFVIVGGFAIVVVLSLWWFCHIIWFTLCFLSWHGEGKIIVVVVLSWLITGDTVLVCLVFW